MDVTDCIPRVIHPDLVWLAKAEREAGKGWFKAQPGKRPEGDPRPRTDLVISLAGLQKAPGAATEGAHVIRVIDDARRTGKMVPLGYFEAAATALGDGPKLFRPTEEQWESMENVKIHLPMREFRTPYPVLFVSIPPEARRRLIQRFGVEPDRMPKLVMIRFRHEPGENPFLFLMSRFGGVELFHIIQDQEGNEDLEDCIQRKVLPDEVSPDMVEFNDRDRDHDYPCSQILARVAVNFCLMLTHYGHTLGGPVDPAAYQKHRQKKHLHHMKHGDCLAVHMKQEITVRKTQRGGGVQGPGTGIEMAPHWVTGHWRAMPGYGARRASGEKVPLVFVRPYIVRSDRIVGDLSESQVVYSG